MSKTLSEQLFETYLDSHAPSGQWEYERIIEGQEPTPDYRLSWHNTVLYFEVKETYSNSPLPSSAHWVAPYTRLRAKIGAARPQFKALKAFSCSLVVCNINNWEIGLDPLHVFGAMLGNLGFTADFNAARGEVEVNNAFLSDGKMVHPGTHQPRNTTISSVIVLEKKYFPTAECLAKRNATITEQEAALKRKLAPREVAEAMDHLIFKGKWAVVDVVRLNVIENPFARCPLPPELFCGAYDERWQMKDDRPTRVYAGEQLLLLEKLQADNRSKTL
jgi:hypothetical protein